MIPVHLDDERAQAFLDGLLPEEERRDCEAHLEACEACALTVDSYRALASALGDLAAAVPPPDFTADVLGCIEAREAERARERRTAGVILGLAAAAAALLVAVAGASTLAPLLSRIGDLAGGLATTLQLASSVAAPVVRALRLEILVATAGAALPLLFALRRLTLRRAEAGA